MATADSSLFNMTVATDMASGNQGLLMPKLQYRFRVMFVNFGSGDGIELTKQVIDVSRPSVQFQEITLPVYNSTIYLSGKHQWQAITVNVRDDANGSIARAIGAQVQKQFDFVEQSSAAVGQDYKFLMEIEMLDGGNGTHTPIVLEKWELYGCFIASANYNNLNYGTNDVVTIQLSIRFDNAIQSPIGSGVGFNTPRAISGDSTTGIGASGNA